jgi:serine/threonine protein kinase
MTADGSERHPLDELAEDFVTRYRLGERPSMSDYVNRYPELASQVAEVLQALMVMEELGPERDGAHEAGADPGRAPPTPRQLGEYRIVREIGRGGMGIVYLAEQVSLGRPVALKVLPFAAALDRKQLSRFKTEAQAAAQLHHTNIVPVHAVGCEQGVHFYAMQFIEGQTLAAIIRELRHLAGHAHGEADREEPTRPQSTIASRTPPGTVLSTERSIRSQAFLRMAATLGIQAAQALEHAHQEGVVHRDIKPANLLVDARGNLWVTDFGLAQVQTDSRLTLSGDLVGTLRYMSPEQALAQREQIDHRTDIYSLGATLYELLTLEPVFHGQDRQELLRQIAFEEPRPPQRLNRALPGELETIVLKALAKSPEERYASAQELADDLARFLKDEPVRARRPTLARRLQKWSRRHQGIVVTAGVSLLLLLCTALAALATGYLLVRRERDQKDDALIQLRLEKDRADANLARAKQAVKDYLTQTADNPELKAANFHDLRKRLLSTAVPFYEEFTRQKQDDSRSAEEQADAYQRLANIRAEIGERKQAVVDYEQARAIFARLESEAPSDPQRRLALAQSDILLGWHLFLLGRHADAEAADRRAVRVLEQLVALAPDVPVYRRDLASASHNLGYLLLEVGRQAEGEAGYHRTQILLEELVAQFPQESDYRRRLAGSYNNLCIVLGQSGRAREGLVPLRKSLALKEKLVEESPEVALRREELAGGYNNLGWLLGEAGEQAEAEAAFRKALAIHEKLAADFPAVLLYSQEVGRDYHNFSWLLGKLGRTAEAEEAVRKALAVKEKLATDPRATPRHQQDLANSYDKWGTLLRELGRRGEAEAALRKALALQEKLVADSPAVALYRKELAKTCHDLGNVLGELARREEAEAAYDKAFGLYEKLAKEFPAAAAEYAKERAKVERDQKHLRETRR